MSQESDRQTSSVLPKKEVALELIRLSGMVSLAAALLFAVLLPFAPHSIAFCVAAMCAGLAAFVIFLRLMRRPMGWFFLGMFVFLHQTWLLAQKVCFPQTQVVVSLAWWVLMIQFESLVIFGIFLPMYLFRRQIRRSLGEE